MFSPPTISRALGAALIFTALLQVPTLAAVGASLDIATDTVWQGVVDVQQEVRVLGGATLLIQPGTTVRFSTEKTEGGAPKTRLSVTGTLIAQGTADAPILFTSAGGNPRPGDWGGIVLERAIAKMSRLSHARVEGGIVGVSGAYSVLVVEHTTITNNVTGIYALQEFTGTIIHSTISGNEVGMHYHQSSRFQVEDCQITGNRNGGIACILNSSPTLRLSLIADNGPKGIVCIQGASPRIEGNTIRGHERGIFMELQARPAIVRNAITGNETGIWGEKMVFPSVAGNEIADNGTGIYCNYSAYMQIHGNNIRDNKKFGLVVGDNMSILMEKKIPFRHMGQSFFDKPPEEVILPEQTRKFVAFPPGEEGIVDARGNWWGKAATDEMEKLGKEGNVSVIEDVHDKPDTFYEGEAYRRDRVVFSPWESGPRAETAPPVKAYSGVTGKVVVGGKPVGGVRVHVYLDAKNAFKGAGYTYSVPTARDGSYELDLAQGTYYLVAKGPLLFPDTEPGSEAFFGYHGGNPVQVSPGSFATANLQVVRRAKTVVTERADAAKSRIAGVVLGPAGPVVGASVYVYTDASRQFHGPDLFGPQGAVPGGTDDKGTFSIELPPGNYYLVASKRKSGDMLGPLRPGDLHGYFDGNPVASAPGSTTVVTVQVVEKLRESAAPAKGSTGIRGKALDPSGKAPAAVYAFATRDPSFMIGAMPPHRSLPVGQDGSFFIDLPEGGTYYVSARSGYGGPPLPGEWHGFYGEKNPRAVVVEKDHVTEGVDFVIKKME